MNQTSTKIYQNPVELRRDIRLGQFTSTTSSQCPGYIQANMVILPKTIANEFLQFCQLNPRACPLLEVLPPGSYAPTQVAKTDVDIRTDLPKYRVYRNGELITEVSDIKDYWNDNMVTFLLGCSFSFENALQQHGIRIKNIDQNKNVAMYKCSKIKCKGPFENVTLIVSMRPIRNDQVNLAEQITGEQRFEKTHGKPLYCGYDYMEKLGVNQDLNQVDFGDSVEIDQGTETPCFWYCGVTGIMAAIEASKIAQEICITHSPGHMLVTDVKDNDEVLQ
ncbi:unnamed protein product [Rotaria sordida]|uniref:DUF1445 domain-containing protein n=1 Tax=Rotaria sordida TaxID=392033 RepID=A0A814UUM0_9BILA|nr:unnamed protein product [Rotaria sordida]CAF1438266.1 unnamed protein product [Rotaria sordida]